MELKQMIREYKNKTGVSDAQIARVCGVNRSTAARWASGEVKKVSPEASQALSRLLGYNIEPILKGYDITVKLPVLGYVKAGYDLFAEENWLGEEEASLQDSKNADYYLKVSGNSMNGIGIMQDSLVLVHRQDHIESGEIGVVMIAEEVTVKRVVYRKGLMILEAANPDIENRYFTAAEVKELPVRVIGKVLSCKTYF